jgi:hypothetical protein
MNPVECRLRGMKTPTLAMSPPASAWKVSVLTGTAADRLRGISSTKKMG